MRQTTRMLLAAAGLMTCVVAAPPASAGQLYLTAEQVAHLRYDFTFVRSCPAELDPYAIEEKGGDCVGGQSGEPQQTSGGG